MCAAEPMQCGLKEDSTREMRPDASELRIDKAEHRSAQSCTRENTTSQLLCRRSFAFMVGTSNQGNSRPSLSATYICVKHLFEQVRPVETQPFLPQHRLHQISYGQSYDCVESFKGAHCCHTGLRSRASPARFADSAMQIAMQIAASIMTRLDNTASITASRIVCCICSCCC